MSELSRDTIVQDEIDIEAVKHRSIKGIIILAIRSVFLNVFALVSTFILTIFLSPAEFGVFFVVSAIVSFLRYFSDVGLAAALIQKKEQIEDTDLATTFTIQQLLVIAIVLIALGLSSLISGLYQLSPEGLTLLRALIVAFFLSSLKTIPSILLERKLKFNRLIIPEILESIVFNGTVVYFAWKGSGIESYTIAVLLRGIVGLIAIYILQPWVPKFGINKKSAKKLLSFGVPFQVNSLLALVKDELLTIYIGTVLPFSQMGFIAWGQKWALTPLRFFSDSIIKVTFPAYSRLQHRKDLLKKAVEKTLFAVSSVVFPSVVGIVVIAPAMIQVIPKYEKWQPALLSLTLFGVNALWASISTTLTNTLNATGHIKKSLSLMVMWTVFTWTLTPILVKLFGYNGVALASALTASSSIIVIYIVKKIVDFEVMPNVTAPLISTALIGMFVYALTPMFATSYLRVGFLILLAVILYALLMMVFAGGKIREEILFIKNNLKKT